MTKEFNFNDFSDTGEYSFTDIRKKFTQIENEARKESELPWMDTEDTVIAEKLLRDLANPLPIIRATVQVEKGKRSIVAVDSDQAQVLMTIYNLQWEAIEQGLCKVKLTTAAYRKLSKKERTSKKIPELKSATGNLKLIPSLYPVTPNTLVISRGLATKLRAENGITEVKIESVTSRSRRLNLDRFIAPTDFD